MVSEQNLKRILTEHQLTQVRCQEDWGGIVLKQYAELMEHADGKMCIRDSVHTARHTMGVDNARSQ